jgi:hypothetical protein
MPKRPHPPKEYLELHGKTISRVLDFSGTDPQGPNPVELKCDYCCNPVMRLYCMPVRGFGVATGPREHFVFKGGHWNACATCQQAVEERDPEATAMMYCLKTGLVTLMPALARIHGTVFDCFHGKVRLWLSGDPWPLPPWETVQ